MRQYAKVFLTGLLALAFRGFAATDNPMQWIEVSGYKLTETGGLRPIGGLRGLSVTPGEGVVYSNGESYADNRNVFVATVPFGYRVGKWKKAFDDPFVLTKGEDVEGSEGATSVTIPWEDRGNVVYLALILELDDRRTVTIGKTPFGAGTVGTNLGTYACLKGDVFRLDAVPEHDSQTGFDRSSFRRWSDGVTSGRRTVTVDTNLTLIAEFVPKSWEVSFDANGGSVIPTSKWVTCDASYGWLPTPAKPGSRFDGWYSQPDDGAPVGFETAVGAVGDHFLYARWSPVTYAIDYALLGDGNGFVEGIGQYPFGNEATLTAKAYEGSVFAGWEDGETRNPRRVTVTSNAVYGARFDIATYDVTFAYRDETGKVVTTDPTNVAYGAAAMAPQVPKWPEHTFKNWSTEEYKKVTRDLSVEAIYDVDTYSVAFTYHDWQGNCVTTMPQNVVSGGRADPPGDFVVNNWPGHTFRGWQPDYSVIRSDRIVEAVYDDDVYAVDFVYFNEESISCVHTEPVAFGGLVPFDAVSSLTNLWTGHPFRYWSLGGKEVSGEVVVSNDLTITAVYAEPVSCTVDYSVSGDGDGIVEGTGTYDFGASVTLTATPREGSAFAGWADGETHNPRRVTVTSNVTYGAKFELKTYDVTFVYHGKDGREVTESKKAKHGKSAELPKESAYNSWPYHSFSGWSSTDYNAVTHNLTGSESIKAEYEEYGLVIYDANGGEGGPFIETNYTGEVTLAANTFTRIGYKSLQEWGTNTASSVYFPAGTTLEVEKKRDNYFYAHLEPITYTLHFVDKEGRGGNMYGLDDRTLTYDVPAKITYSLNPLSRCGFDNPEGLKGWDTNADASEPEYPWNNSKEYGVLTVTNLTTKADFTVIFYAIWEKGEEEAEQ